MIYSFKDLQDLILAEARHTNDPLMRTRVKSWLNLVKWELETALDLPMLNSTFQFSTAATDTEHLLPIDVSAILNVRILDKAGDRDFARTVQPWSADEFDWDVPLNRGDTGFRNIPDRYRWRRVDGIRADPPGPAGSYSVASTVGTDTGPKVVVNIVGYADSARTEIQTASGPLHPTNGTNLNPIGSLFQAIAASKNVITTGVVKVFKGAAIVAVIQPGELSATQFVIEFRPLPDAVYLCEVRYRRRSPPMTLDGDAPWMMPPEGEAALLKGGKWMALDFIDDNRAAAAKAAFDESRAIFFATQRPNLVDHVGFDYGQSVGVS